MRDKPDAAKKERKLPPPCMACQSLHKQYASPLYAAPRRRLWGLEVLRALPILGRIVPAWECDLQKYKTVEDIEREEARS